MMTKKKKVFSNGFFLTASSSEEGIEKFPAMINVCTMVANMYKYSFKNALLSYKTFV